MYNKDYEFYLFTQQTIALWSLYALKDGMGLIVAEAKESEV